MPNKILPIALNKGLDTTGAPLMLEPGTLSDCLNYEMTSHSGYRRIDGYEKYDGWLNGDLSNYYSMSVIITDGSVSAQLTPGTTLYSASLTAPSRAVGTVLGYIGGTGSGTIIYAPADPYAPVITDGLALTYSTGGVAPTINAGAVTDGLATDSASAFLINLRAYSATLRAAVQSFPSAAVGLHWFRNNLIVALDCPALRYTDTTSTKNSVFEGVKISYNGQQYQIVDKLVAGNKVTLQVEPLGTWSPVSSSIIVEGPSSSIITVNATGITLDSGGNSNAYLVSANNLQTSFNRGNVLLHRSTILKFSGGLAAAATDMQPGGLISVGSGVGTYFQHYVKTLVITSGSFAGNNAAGWVEILPLGTTGAGNLNYITTTHDIQGFTGTPKYADIDQVILSKIAGSAALTTEGTYYQWQTYNFYGQDGTTEAYGATGASRGFWAMSYVDPLTKAPPLGVSSSDVATVRSWGNIITDIAYIGYDMPRYVSRHASCLVFGFRGGSVELSAVGEPRNFAGIDGAQEIATGDQMAGLLEAPGDSLIIFGRRSIHRIQGDSTAIQLDTVAGNAGAFDYTAVLVGTTPVFTGPAGISTLEQTAAYGDFQGKRLSYSVSNTLNPLLRPSATSSTNGGVVMALPIRSKDQYRLWLSSGEVYVVTLTAEGPKITTSNYGLGTTGPGNPRKFGLSVNVPLAWTSEVGDSGRERVFVVWDYNMARLNLKLDGTASAVPDSGAVYQLDAGWGFNGKTFSSYFELSPLFSVDGNSFEGITKARLHGMGYGLATLDIKSAGIESDYDQTYHTAVQDISMPITTTKFYRYPSPVTAQVDEANWGLGIKLRIQTSLAENLTVTEPSHTCQVLVLSLNTEGVPDL